jgi:hypothetical protein
MSMSTTLLCWCRNDSEVSTAAKAFKADYRYSGCRIAALPQTLARLSGDDVLIITAHGNSSSLGEEVDSFSDLTLDRLAQVLNEHAPSGWSGSLCFDTCHGLDFARKLKPKIAKHLPGLKLFGCVGETDMDVDLSKHQQA